MPGHDEKEVAPSTLPQAYSADPSLPEAYSPNRDERSMPQPLNVDGLKPGDLASSADPPEKKRDGFIRGNIIIKKRTLWIGTAALLLVIGAVVGGVVGSLRRRNLTGSSTLTGNPGPDSPSTTPTISVTNSASSTSATRTGSIAKETSIPVGYPDSIPSNNLVRNGEFKSNFDEWTSDIGDRGACWSGYSNTSPIRPNTFGRNWNAAPTPCAMRQIIPVAAGSPGKFWLTFFYGTWNDIGVCTSLLHPYSASQCLASYGEYLSGLLAVVFDCQNKTQPGKFT